MHKSAISQHPQVREIDKHEQREVVQQPAEASAPAEQQHQHQKQQQQVTTQARRTGSRGKRTLMQHAVIIEEASNEASNRSEEMTRLNQRRRQQTTRRRMEAHTEKKKKTVCHSHPSKKACEWEEALQNVQQPAKNREVAMSVCQRGEWGRSRTICTQPATPKR